MNNKQFRRMKPREGTDVDQAKLEETFRKLGFIVKVYKDLGVKDMAGVMKDMSMMDHSKFDAFVVCILSHGGENFYYKMGNEGIGRPTSGHDEQPVQGNFVYGVDEKAIPIRYLTMYFRASMCKTLADKPKLFFIQACQGAESQRGVVAQSDFDHDGPSIEESISMDIDVLPPSQQDTDPDATPQAADNQKVIPDEADFILGYATVFGYVSFRSRSQGSFYITSLTENLDDHADTLDLQQIMVKVNHDVSERNVQMDGGDAKKQVPMTQSTLRKNLYFSPDNLSLSST